MGDKGGDNFWVASAGGKSSMKTKPRKDDSSGKTKKAKKVQFEYEGATQENIMFSSKSGGKGDLRNGKGDKGSNGPRKTVVKKDTTPLELLVEQELPKNVNCMMDCEAAEILEGIRDQMVLLSADPAIKLPASFDKAFEYAKVSSRFADPQSVMQALQILRKHGAAESEICMIANVCPETTDEVFALVPSLKVKKSRLAEPLKDVLKELAMLKTTKDSPFA
uniref:RNA polymerase Rpb4/RPC9 core domain-containing protein n=1 Tax=Kalanchoe fedtschenkoi TaxID=63787 RepID=A0A7N0UW81_KALFE